jgi:hypothetical protein
VCLCVGVYVCIYIFPPCRYHFKENRCRKFFSLLLQNSSYHFCSMTFHMDLLDWFHGRNVRKLSASGSVVNGYTKFEVQCPGKLSFPILAAYRRKAMGWVMPLLISVTAIELMSQGWVLYWYVYVSYNHMQITGSCSYHSTRIVTEGWNFDMKKHRRY